MAEVVGLVASAITLAATAQGAAQLSKVVFKVVSTFKNAPKEMNTIASELSLFSGSLQTLADIIAHYERLCKPQFFEGTKTIMLGYRDIENDLKLLIDTSSPKTLLKLRWCMAKPKAKNLLRKIEGIKSALTLQLQIVQLAKEQITHLHMSEGNVGQGTNSVNRWRSVVETVVQANRQLVEDAQLEDIEDPVQRHAHSRGERTTLDVWKENSFDTATWLYHLVFSPSVQDPPFQATVSDENLEEQAGLVALRSAPRKAPEEALPPTTREMIVWNSRTEPKHVVDKLLFTWTTLSHEQIRLTSAQQVKHDWSDRALQMLDDAKKETEQEKIVDSEVDGTDDENIWRPLSFARAKRAQQRESLQSSKPRPHVRFKHPAAENASSRPGSTPVPPIAPDFRDTDTDDDAAEPTEVSRDPRRKTRLTTEDDPWIFSVAEERNNNSTAAKTTGNTKKFEDRTTAAATPSPAWTSNPSDDEWGFVGSKTKKKMGETGDSKVAPLSRQDSSKQPVDKVAEPAPVSKSSKKKEKRAHVETESEYDSYDDTVSMSTNSTADTVTASSSSAHQPNLQDDYPYISQRPFGHVYPTYPPPPPNPTWNSFNPFASPDLGGPLPGYPPTMHPPITHPPPPVMAPNTNDSRLSKIERLLTAQQQKLAQVKNEQTSPNNDAEMKRLSNVTEEYNKTIRQLAQSLDDKKGSQQQVAADAIAERKQVMAAAEEKLRIIHGLEKLISQQKEEQRKAEEKWSHEKLYLQEQAEKAAQLERLAHEDATTAQQTASKIQKSLELLQVQVETERRVRIENEVKLAESRRKRDEENTARFEGYEKLLKASRLSQDKKELDTQRPVRQTLVRDHGRSIEVNEFTNEALGPSPSTLSSPLRFIQNSFWRPEANTKHDNGPRSRRERHNSFATSHKSPSSGLSLAGFGNSYARQNQQTIVFCERSNTDNARLARLQDSLTKLGVQTTFDDSSDPGSGDMALSGIASDSLVRSTLFWEAPMLTLGSELLLTMRDMGWKLNYSRKSAGGRTYFLGDQPIHSYFFQDDYSPHFTPPISCTQYDAVLIDKGWIEEYALLELGFEYRLAPTGEYELDGRLTFGDLESLVERSFLMKENAFRRQYRQLQWHTQPNTPQTPCASSFEERYAPSTVSSVSRSSRSRSSRRSCVSTVTGQNDDARYESSQTSQMGFNDDRSISDGACDDTASSAVASWVDSTTNPFRKLPAVVKARVNKNPWVEDVNWDGISSYSQRA